MVTYGVFATIAQNYWMIDASLGRIVKKTSKVLQESLIENSFLECPEDYLEMRGIAKYFGSKRKFPNFLA